MPVRAILPHPRIDAARGCIALARGPIVYCLEQVDQSTLLEDIHVAAATLPEAIVGADGVVVLAGKGYNVPPTTPEIYTDAGTTTVRAAREVDLTAVPYFRWGNRGPNAMRVWIPTVTDQVTAP
jgi:DUF1680 family protein